ncbi:MAG TPA: hypothetical protein VJ957_02740 [Longimicrobiales bacterium]|nr:hypothetical protein [Longimicrobiales bacterium]
MNGQAERGPAHPARFFRCTPLGATITVAVCRRYRALPMGAKEPRGGGLGASGAVRPLCCRDCALARDMEAGRVQTFDKLVLIERRDASAQRDAALNRQARR